MENTDVSSERVRFLRARVLGSLGWLEGQSRMYEAALNHLQRAVDGWRQLTELNPTAANLRYELAGSLRDIAFVSGYAEDHAESARYMEEAIREQERLFQLAPLPRYAVADAELRVRMGVELFKAGKVEAGRTAVRQGQDRFLKLAGAPDAGLRALMLAARYLVDVPSPDLLRPAEALPLAQRLEQLGAEDSTAMEVLSSVYAYNGMRAETERTLQRFEKLVPPTNDNGRRLVANLRNEMETVLAAQGK